MKLEVIQGNGVLRVRVREREKVIAALDAKRARVKDSRKRGHVLSNATVKDLKKN